MANVVNQPSVNPTNKLTASVVGTSVWGTAMLLVGLVLKNEAPGWYDPEVLASITLTGTTVAGFIAGWLTPDKPNVVVITQDQNQ